MKWILLASLTTFLVSKREPKWGFFAHRMINELAVFTVPAPLFDFYKKHQAYLSEHATDADKRRYSDSMEAPRHYLDIEHYEQTLPLDSIPPKWRDAVVCYGEDSLRAYGIVPWHIVHLTEKLSNAFASKNIKLILKYSADLGHYVGDCHVPLHSTENYNGQLTNQHGIHSFWESRLPSLFSQEYDFFTGPATYIRDVNTEVWKVISESHAALDSVLHFEKLISQHWKEDRKYTLELQGNRLLRLPSENYSRAYHDMLNGQVERRMRESIKMTGSLWYTAWINAGQPVFENATMDSTTSGEDVITERPHPMIGRPED